MICRSARARNARFGTWHPRDVWATWRELVVSPVADNGALAAHATLRDSRGGISAERWQVPERNGRGSFDRRQRRELAHQPRCLGR
jgi:hypothetical protein